MFKAYHFKEVGPVAEVTSWSLERALMRVIGLMTYTAGSRVFEPENELALGPGTVFMTGRAGCDRV